MYVKVTGDAEHGDTIWETGGPVQSGFYAILIEQVVDGDPVFDFKDGLPYVPSTLHIHEIDVSQQTKHEKEHNRVAVRFAWWPDAAGDSVGVVTTRNIFLVGDNGKTIDRVR
jgi:hypothetical protein